MITAAQLQSVYRTTPASTIQTYVQAINDTCSAYSITTKLRQAMFLAQMGHESAGLTAVKENLNYSSTALLKVFPKYFDTSTSIKYQRNPEMIANRVYANRMGNGSEASGDGWACRGRGAIQITGKSNYLALAHDLNLPSDVSKIATWLESPLGVVKSAGWFWNEHSLNRFADLGDVVGCTKIINGGTNGLDDRKALYALALKAL